MTNNANEAYMVVLHEKTLQMEIKPFQDGIQPLYELIECDTIDHSSSIDVLNELNIDMWVDDEGLLKSRCPVFVFLDEENNVQGLIVGNVVFQKSNDEGESYGMTEDEAYGLMEWIDAHDSVAVELYNGTMCECFVIYPYETMIHRSKIADMIQWAKDNNWQVFKM